MANIVLVHGFPGFARIGSLEYFRGVKGRLEQNCGPGVQIVEAELDPVGTIPTRAEKLKEIVEPLAPVHIIAQSAGGIDARFLVSKNGLKADKLVDSITSVGTPHGGTVLAELAVQLAGQFEGSDLSLFFSSLVAAAASNPLSVLGSLASRLTFGPASPAGRLLSSWGITTATQRETLLQDLSGSLSELNRFLAELSNPSLEAISAYTRENMRQFNKLHPNVAGVEYFSYAGVSGIGGGNIVSPIFAWSHLLVLTQEGRNDGWISVDSATWPEFRGEIEADHLDQIGHGISSGFFRFGRRFDHLQFYGDVAREVGACT